MSANSAQARSGGKQEEVWGGGVGVGRWMLGLADDDAHDDRVTSWLGF
jgi:hypothetical protein